MSSNLELVRSIYSARESGDFSSADWADPEIEYVFADGPSPGTYTGLAAMATAMREVLGAWEHVRTVVDEYRSVDEKRVLVLLHHSGRGRTSGLQLDALATYGADLVDITDGKVMRIVKYYDRDRALSDLGLDAGE